MTQCCMLSSSDLSLDHGRPLCPEHLHRLEDVNHAFVAHSLEHDAEGNEDSGPADASTKHTEHRQLSHMFLVIYVPYLQGCSFNRKLFGSHKSFQTTVMMSENSACGSTFLCVKRAGWTRTAPSRTRAKITHTQTSKHFVWLSPSHVGREVRLLPPPLSRNTARVLTSDPEILESCLSKLLCCEMTSTSPMEQ